MLRYLFALSLILVSSGASAQNWQPTEVQTKNLQAMVQAYFHALDERDYSAAYAYMTPSLKSLLSFDQFVANRKNADIRFGRPASRLVEKVSWYPGSTQGGTGLAAAIDFSGTLRNAQKFCGYVAVAEVAPATFLLMRDDTTYVDPEIMSNLTPAERVDFLNRPGCSNLLKEALNANE